MIMLAKAIKPYIVIALVISMLLAFCSSSAYAASATEPEIRVRIGQSASATSYTFTVTAGSYQIVRASDRTQQLGTLAAGESITLLPNDGQLCLPLDDSGRFQFNNTTYRGGFKVMRGNSYTVAINVIEVEDYLYGVVGREIGYNCHTQALAAQAVAARSYAISNISSANVYYDVTNDTYSQVYGGYSAETSKIRTAVDATAGWIVKSNGSAFPCFYSSNAGGWTEDIANVWAGSTAPLKGVESSYDAYASKYGLGSTYSWSVSYTPAQLVNLANQYGKTDIGSFVGISMSTTYNGATSVSGRAMVVTISGTKGVVSATRDNIRSLLDLKSTLITISDVSTPAETRVLDKSGKSAIWTTLSGLYASAGSGVEKANGSASTIYVRTANGVEQLVKENAATQDKIIINGKGFGHGLGLSQCGAMAMADDGWSWQEIITHYFCSGGPILTQAYETE